MLTNGKSHRGGIPMKGRLRRRVLRLALVTTALLGLAGGIAYATIPDGGKVFHACMLNKVGTVRLIDKTLPASAFMSHCNSALETEVSWNEVGQQGLQGLKGDPGTDGAPGKNGVDGAPGKNGVDGRNGVDGKDGAAGAQGPPGPGLIDGLTYVSKFGFIGGDRNGGATAACPNGLYAVGGGAQQQGDPDVLMVESYPTRDRHGWFVWFGNTHSEGFGGNGVDYEITVVCAPATNVTPYVIG
jgi:hypothetical protein